ncbi:hypothetical protein ACFL0E_01030, partial [Nanoarchaeota archaeon]
SFLTIGTALVEMYNYDFKLPRKLSFFLALFIPLVIGLSGLTTFIVVIGTAGAIAGGIDGILIVLAYWRAKKLGNRKPEYSLNIPRMLSYVIIFMFALGVLYQIWNNFF